MPNYAHQLWDTGAALAASFASLLTGIAVPAETVKKASFERENLNDAPVWRLEPHTHVGDVERVLVDEDTEEIKELVIRRGAFFGEDVVLPMEYVTEIQDGVVHVQLTDEELGGCRRTSATSYFPLRHKDSKGSINSSACPPRRPPSPHPCPPRRRRRALLARTARRNEARRGGHGLLQLVGFAGVGDGFEDGGLRRRS